MGPEERKEYKKSWSKETYEWRKAHGICVKCGKNDARKGKVTCLMCSFKSHNPMTEEQRKRHNEADYIKRHTRIAEGKCPDCGKPAYPGHQRCYECMLRHRRQGREYQKRHEKGYAAAGMCIRCGKEPLPGRTVCAECLEKMRATAARNFGPNWARNAYPKPDGIRILNTPKVEFGGYRRKGGAVYRG